MVGPAVFGVLAFCLVLGLPIALSLGIASTVGILLTNPANVSLVAQKVYSDLESFPLMAIPFFVLASNLMATGGVARRLVSFAQAYVGHLYGGLAMSGVIACALFAAISGSSPATVIAIGGLMIPAMFRAGYDRNYAVGSMANAGSLGILIPPSIPMIVFAFVTNESVGKLFMAGVVPGIMLTFMLLVTSYIVARRRGYRTGVKATWADRWHATVDALPALLLPLVVIGGIYGVPFSVNVGPIQIQAGAIFTPTEAAAVAVMVAFVVGMFMYRELNWSDLPKVFADSAKTTAMLMFIISMAVLFGFFLTSERIPERISAEVLTHAREPWLILLIMNVILLLAGDFLEASSIILIFAPIFFPIAQAVGINPIHLGIVFVVNLEIGMITPPVGLNLYVASGIAKMSLYQVMRASLPWMLVLVAALVIVTYIPELSLWLPRLLYGGV
jgi:C4-dicarboxylate transporter DctM subunit